MKHLHLSLLLSFVLLVLPASTEMRAVYLETGDEERIRIADIMLHPDGSYSVNMNDAAFSDHFLSMRPFKCVEHADKHWCHVPYPYAINRNVSADLTDLEYDFLFVWKGATEYGINFWNGIYYKLDDAPGQIVGTAFEMDMNQLAVPPAADDLRPVKASDLHESDPDSHLFPRLVID